MRNKYRFIFRQKYICMYTRAKLKSRLISVVASVDLFFYTIIIISVLSVDLCILSAVSGRVYRLL